jgi:AraC-like DNA-binding protein
MFQENSYNLPYGKSFILHKLTCEEFSVIRTHQHYELDLITSGSGKRIVGNKISTFENGDLILIGPNLSHGCDIVQTDPLDPPECWILILSQITMESSLIHIQELVSVRHLFNRAISGLAFKGDVTDEIKQLFDKLIDLQGVGSLMVLLEILKTLSEIKDTEILTLTPELPVTNYKDLNQIRIIYDFVIHNIQDSITIDTAAGLLNMAPGSFSRFFKKRTGKPFIQYVKDIRISLACKMLSDTEKPIAQIGYESGYNNLANFNFYFKSVMRMTPSEYRKNFR